MKNTGMGQIRKNNTRNRILHIIRTHERVSKMEIKTISRYSMATVLDIVDSLLEDGLVYYSEKGSGKSGRRPTYISISSDGGYFLGLSFHARGASAALVNYRGEVVDFLAESFDRSLVSVSYVLERSLAMLQNMLERNGGLRRKILGIGLGVPGYVDDRAGMSVFYSHVDNWRDIPLREMVEKICPDIPVRMENNSNAVALAYKWLVPNSYEGAAVIIYIRSGVHMSCIIDGDLYKGSGLTAGEIGHTRVEGGKRSCPCGKRGCLDTEASDTALCEKILEGIRDGRFREIWDMSGHDTEKVNMDLFLESVRAGDSDSVALLDETCAFLGEALTQIVNMLNPSKIIFHARLCELGDIFFSRVRTEIEKSAISLAAENLKLEPVIFGEQTAAVGAAAVAMEQEWFHVDAII